MTKLLLRASRFLGLGSAIYIAFVISVNVGYIDVVGLWASEFFSITDTLQINVLLLRNAFFVVGAFVALGFLVIMPLFLSLSSRRWLEKINYSPDWERSKTTIFSLMSVPNWNGYIFMFMVLMLFAIASVQAEKGGFLLQLLPIMTLTALQCSYLLYMRNQGSFSEVFFLLGLLVNLLFLGNSVGKAWARDDQINADRIVSVYDVAGACQIRHVARVVSSGIIFYNEYSRSYEFRRFDTIRSITPRVTCVT